MGCFFSGCFVCWGPKVPWLLLQQSCVGREASSRQEGRPSSLTLTPVCLSCLLTPDMGWDNPGSGAKLVTSTYQIRAESCINPLLTDLCSVLAVFGFLYFFLVFHVPGPNVLLLKLCFVTGEEGREEVWHCWGPRALSSKIQLISLGLHTCLNLPMCGNYFSEWDGNEKGKKPQCLHVQSASPVLDPQKVCEDSSVSAQKNIMNSRVISLKSLKISEVAFERSKEHSYFRFFFHSLLNSKAVAELEMGIYQ